MTTLQSVKRCEGHRRYQVAAHHLAAVGGQAGAQTNPGTTCSRAMSASAAKAVFTKAGVRGAGRSDHEPTGQRAEFEDVAQ